jgi:hypothetical protein
MSGEPKWGCFEGTIRLPYLQPSKPHRAAQGGLELIESRVHEQQSNLSFKKQVFSFRGTFLFCGRLVYRQPHAASWRGASAVASRARASPGGSKSPRAAFFADAASPLVFLLFSNEFSTLRPPESRRADDTTNAPSDWPRRQRPRFQVCLALAVACPVQPSEDRIVAVGARLRSARSSTEDSLLESVLHRLASGHWKHCGG